MTEGRVKEVARVGYHILYRKCWECIFCEDANHSTCNGDATDAEDTEAYYARLATWSWLNALGPIPMEMPTGSGLDLQTPFGLVWAGSNPGNHPGADPPYYACACWCQKPELYRESHG